jgi:type I restriction enzyme M protein
MISSMKHGSGRVGVVMPHGVLFRGGAEARVRQCLLERDLFDAVIGLPPNLFYSTAIPACILVFRGQKTADRKNHVLFVDGSARFAKGKNQNRMTDEDIKILIEAYQTGADPDGEGGANVRLVPFDEIKANGFDLNIGRDIKVAAEETADLGTALVVYADARQKRLETEAAMFERLAAAGIDSSMFEVPGE